MSYTAAMRIRMFLRFMNQSTFLEAFHRRNSGVGSGVRSMHQCIVIVDVGDLFGDLDERCR
jgi:hypothetical protein